MKNLHFKDKNAKESRFTWQFPKGVLPMKEVTTSTLNSSIIQYKG